jgi:hypothetical protein
MKSSGRKEEKRRKLQAPSLKPKTQAASDKLQAPSSKLQATSRERQALEYLNLCKERSHQVSSL